MRSLVAAPLLVLVLCAALASAGPYAIRILNLDTSQSQINTVLINGRETLRALRLTSASDYIPVVAPSISVAVTKPSGELFEVFTAQDTSTTTEIIYMTLVVFDSTLGLVGGVLEDRITGSPGQTLLRVVNIFPPFGPGPSEILSADIMGDTPTPVITSTTIVVKLDPPMGIYAYTPIPDAFVPLEFAIASVPVARVNITSTESGAVTCFSFLASPAGSTWRVVCPHGERARLSGNATSGELPGGVVTKGLKVTSGNQLSIVGPTVVFNDASVSGRGSILRAAAPLNVFGDIFVAPFSAFVLDAYDGGEMSVFNLVMGPNVTLGASFLFTRALPLVVNGTANIEGTRLVVDLQNIQFTPGTELVLMTCNPCVGNFSQNVTVIGFQGSSTGTFDTDWSEVLSAQNELNGRGANILSEEVALVSCSETECVLKADSTQLGLSRTSSGEQSDKVVIAVLTVFIGLVVLAGIVVRCLCWEDRKKPINRKDYDTIDRKLREHERVKYKEHRANRVRDNVLHSGDLSVSVMEFDSTDLETDGSTTA